MGSYTIFTDSGCDLAPSLLQQWGVSCVDLTFHIDGSPRQYVNANMPPEEFYRRMRAGSVFKTAAVNPNAFRVAFEAALQQGEDVLYLGLSSGLSNTSTAGLTVARELQADYPRQKLIAVDTRCASGGLGLLVCLAARKRRQGVNLEETACFIRSLAPGICHWFTVDDLTYLRRGGRVSAAAAFVGGMLDLRPVLHVDDNGRLVCISRARGRNQSIRALAQKYTELATDPENGVYFIAHGDCMEDARALEAAIRQAHGASAALITDFGPVIGSHAGPGTLALFFPGKKR